MVTLYDVTSKFGNTVVEGERNAVLWEYVITCIFMCNMTMYTIEKGECVGSKNLGNESL